MRAIEERRLGAPGIEWVRRALIHTILGDLVLARYSLDSGVATALLPDTVSDDDAHQFDEGVLEPPDSAKAVVVTQADGSVSHLVPKPSTDQYLVRIIQGFLRGGASYVCVFEDYMHRPGELSEEAALGTIVVLNGVVYHVLDVARADETTIAATVRSAGFINTTFGVLGSLRGTVDRSSLDLTEVVAGLNTIIVDAYDGESWVLWRPS